MILINVVQKFYSDGQLEVRLTSYLSRQSISHGVENLACYAREYSRVYGPATGMEFTFTGFFDLGADFAVGPATRDKLQLLVLEDLVDNLQKAPAYFNGGQTQ